MEIYPSDIVIHIINILVLYLLLRLLVYGPVRKFMNARAERIEADLLAAQAARVRAEEQCASYDALLLEADAEAQKRLLAGNRQANEQAAKILADASAQAVSSLEAARTRAAAERRIAVASLQEQITDAAITLAGEILQREVNEKDNRNLIETFFERAV